MRKVLHHSHAVVFAVLLISGFLLHFAILRGPLSAYRLSLIRIQICFRIYIISFGTRILTYTAVCIDHRAIVPSKKIVHIISERCSILTI